jgi:hypothetical protein
MTKSSHRIAVFVDGANLNATAKALGCSSIPKFADTGAPRYDANFGIGALAAKLREALK